jgi:uncharacterized protein
MKARCCNAALPPPHTPAIDIAARRTSCRRMWTPEALLAVALIFIFAGFVKGVAGLGLPTIAIALMAASIGLKEGIALIVVPTIATNLWQAVAGGHFMAMVRRFWSLLLGTVLGAWVGASILAQTDAMLLAAILGMLLCVYSAIGLTRPPIPPPGRAEPWLSPIMGASGGVIGGMTGSIAVPGVIYMQAMGLPRNALVQALGIVFLVFTLALGTSLTSHGLMSSDIGLLSLAATLPAMVGMSLGQLVRHRMTEEMFRPVFFLVLLALGAWLALRPLLT